MELMGKDRLKKFLYPDDYVMKGSESTAIEKSCDTDTAKEWRDLAIFLGLDPDSDPDAMQEVTYYTCIKVLREAIGRMPLRVLRKTDTGGTTPATDKQLYRTLLFRPNKYTYPSLFWACAEQCRLHYGNAYILIRGSGTQRDPTTLWLMPPDEVEVWWDRTKPLDEITDIYYRWSAGGKMIVAKSREVIHLRSSDTWDGIMGIPLIDRLEDVVNGSSKAQRFQNKLIADGMTGKSVLQYTGQINDPAARTFATNIDAYIRGDYADSGVKNVVPIPVGSSLTPLNIKLSDAQFEELKKYNAVQIAAAFGIKPQQIGDMTKASYASSQAQNEAFYTDTMLYIVKSYEEELSSKLLTDKEIAEGLSVEFDTSTTLRSSFENMVKTLSVATQNLILTPDEARAQLKYPTIPGGDLMYANGNIIPLSMAGVQYVRGGLPEGGESE